MTRVPEDNNVLDRLPWRKLASFVGVLFMLLVLALLEHIGHAGLTMLVAYPRSQISFVKFSTSSASPSPSPCTHALGLTAPSRAHR